MAEMQFHTLKIADVQPETDNAVRVSFAVPEELRTVDHALRPGDLSRLERERRRGEVQPHEHTAAVAEVVQPAAP